MGARLVPKRCLDVKWGKRPPLGVVQRGRLWGAVGYQKVGDQKTCAEITKTLCGRANRRGDGGLGSRSLVAANPVTQELDGNSPKLFIFSGSAAGWDYDGTKLGAPHE
jgi:hypothetical protein